MFERYWIDDTACEPNVPASWNFCTENATLGISLWNRHQMQPNVCGCKLIHTTSLSTKSCIPFFLKSGRIPQILYHFCTKSEYDDWTRISGKIHNNVVEFSRHSSWQYFKHKTILQIVSWKYPEWYSAIEPLTSHWTRKNSRRDCLIQLRWRTVPTSRKSTATHGRPI